MKVEEPVQKLDPVTATSPYGFAAAKTSEAVAPALLQLFCPGVKMG